jgi:hypothetical protein
MRKQYSTYHLDLIRGESSWVILKEEEWFQVPYHHLDKEQFESEEAKEAALN